MVLMKNLSLGSGQRLAQLLRGRNQGTTLPYMTQIQEILQDGLTQRASILLAPMKSVLQVVGQGLRQPSQLARLNQGVSRLKLFLEPLTGSSKRFRPIRMLSAT